QMGGPCSEIVAAARIWRLTARQGLNTRAPVRRLGAFAEACYSASQRGTRWNASLPLDYGRSNHETSPGLAALWLHWRVGAPAGHCHWRIARPVLRPEDVQ